MNKKLKQILTKEFLIKEYIENKKTAFNIANDLKTNRQIIYRYLQKFEVKRRTNSESHKGVHYFSKTEFKKGMIPWNRNLVGIYQMSEETKNK